VTGDVTAPPARPKERLPLALSVSLRVLIPLCFLGVLMSGLFFVRWRDEVRARAGAETARRSAEAQVGRMNVLLGQLEAQNTHELELEQLLDELAPNDPRRAAVLQQLSDARTQLAQTQRALLEAAGPGGGPPPAPSTGR